MAEAIPAFTPVNLLTGFLGSGKTTLLRRLLADPALSGTAVLINEFGEVGLDHHLIERIDETVVLLRSGCLCCTIRGELALAIRDLHSRRERGKLPAFGRLVVESTGLADPFPILSTLKADPVLRHHFRAGAVVTTVDAVNGLSQIERHTESTPAGGGRRPVGADQDGSCGRDHRRAASRPRKADQPGRADDPRGGPRSRCRRPARSRRNCVRLSRAADASDCDAPIGDDHGSASVPSS